MNILGLAGVGLLYYAYRDIQAEETDAGLLNLWLSWINISREGSPALYWTLICLEVGAGLFCIYYGLRY